MNPSDVQVGDVIKDDGDVFHVRYAEGSEAVFWNNEMGLIVCKANKLFANATLIERDGKPWPQEPAVPDELVLDIDWDEGELIHPDGKRFEADIGTLSIGAYGHMYRLKCYEMANGQRFNASVIYRHDSELLLLSFCLNNYHNTTDYATAAIYERVTK